MENNKPIKKIPNISHIPQTQVALDRILRFLDKPKEESIFYDFMRSNDIKDSTVRKWKNHLKNINIITEIKDNNITKINLTQFSISYRNKNLSLDEFIFATIKSSTEFNNLLQDIIELSYLHNSFTSISDLYENLKTEFNYINRSISAKRNLTGMLNYMSIGELIHKEKSKIILDGPIFFSNNSFKIFEDKVSEFLVNNSDISGYSNINKLIIYLENHFKAYSKQQINYILRRIIRDSDRFLYQEASSNKEIGVFYKGKNLLFIRYKHE